MAITFCRVLAATGLTIAVLCAFTDFEEELVSLSSTPAGILYGGIALLTLGTILLLIVAGLISGAFAPFYPFQVASPHAPLCDPITCLGRHTGSGLSRWRMRCRLCGAPAAEAGIGRVHWHTLRHTSVTWDAMRGMPVQLIQAKLGHAGVTTTERYLHVANLVDWLRERRALPQHLCPHFPVWRGVMTRNRE